MIFILYHFIYIIFIILIQYNGNYIMYLFIDSRYVASKVILKPRFVCHSAIILEIIVYTIYV